MLTPNEYPMTLTVSHIAEIMGIGRSKAYEIIHNPKFPVIREGRKVIIPRDPFFRWLDPKYLLGDSLSNPSGEQSKSPTIRDKATGICVRAMSEAVRKGEISIEELVQWALDRARV